MTNCKYCRAEIKWINKVPYNLNGISHFETCPVIFRQRRNEVKKYPDTSHDYTKLGLKDKEQTTLK